MPRVQSLQYDMFTDQRHNIRFTPHADVRRNCQVGIAEITDDQVELFEGRDGFKVLTDEEFAAMVGYTPMPTPSGDPLQDEANRKRKAKPASVDTDSVPTSADTTPADADPLAGAPEPPASAS